MDMASGLKKKNLSVSYVYVRFSNFLFAICDLNFPFTSPTNTINKPNVNYLLNLVFSVENFTIFFGH